ncbi:uncharacterized protein KNN_00327 [Bacillus thuringiensis serovar tolworthi]|uniref:Uncharacterized protein n=1 Tax=Bacillus thuringiensis subsp. tolworthi TaxID=1442 RepID=A0A9W3ZRD6_BACTO|nr:MULTISPECIES: hypothetical protein [Bacillus cereus group]MEB8714968.1 hypothetical protein [Bacillus cereus]MEB9431077.1 hypothetical protein [Bacillus cereus]MEB9482566.1 hypothetical protein [Bacillus cereus]MEB9590284.1 hypothetical protein [Bacillus cereus]UPJ16067.1 hypothetical protein MYW48_25840 [Bacillus cereus]
MFRIFKMFAHDVKTYVHDAIQLFKGTNHEQVIPTLIVVPDPIDRMVEKEMAQLKSIKDEKEQEEMSRYKKQITSLDELHEVIDALETLNKKYVIKKVIQQNEILPMGNRYYTSIWYVEEIDVLKKYSDGEEIVKLVCKDCGVEVKGKRNSLEGKSCIHCFNHNTTIVPLNKEC